MTGAVEELSKKFGKDNQCLKLRRNELDSLTGSHRVSFNKRNPNNNVEIFHNGLKNNSFDELTRIAKALLVDNKDFALMKQSVLRFNKLLLSFTKKNLK